jgi:cell division protease FtsH
MRQYKTVLLWVILILLFVGFYQVFNRTNSDPAEIDFTSFLKKADEHQVKSLSIKGNKFTGKFVDEKDFRVNGPDKADGALITRLAGDGVQVKFEGDESNGFLVTLLVQYLPLVFLILFFIFFMRQLQSGGGKAMSFGKSKAKLLNEHTNKVTFADVAGIDECKGELEEIIEFLKDPKKFTKLGGRIPKGVLLMGSPGTGKTLLAKAVAGEAGVPFFSISGSDFVEMFVGVGASRVRDLFEQGKKNAPCIIFIDEIDAVGRHRGAGLGGGHDEREQTLNQLLVEMDGFESNEGVILIAATNRPDVLDPALLRPGRFDRRIVVPRPDVRGRLGIIAVHTRKVPLAPDVDLDIIARGTPGFSGADLENLVNEAALLAARLNKERVDVSDFDNAKDKVLMGTERKSMIMSEREKRTTAIHEAGHAVVAHTLAGPDSDPLHKVTIIPRGRALGVTQTIPAEDRLGYSKEFLTNRIAILMGGRLAEEIVFNQRTTGASDDIEKATDLARRLVCEFGMSDRLGPLSFGTKEGEPFLGRDMTSGKNYSEATAVEIDREVREVVNFNYDRAKKILVDNLEGVKRMADVLMEYETIDVADIELIMAGKPLSKPKPQVKLPTSQKPVEKKEKKKILDALEGLGKLGPEEPSKA